METIEQLLKQAEAQHKIIELNTMFARNMAFFQQALPAIYERFKSYSPTDIQLTLTNDGWLDMVNLKLDNKPVYGRDPLEFAQETVAGFIQNPSFQKLCPEETITLDIENEAHTANTNAVIRKINEADLDTTRSPLEDQIEFLFMLGVGLGYQITELLKHTRIRHLIIAETNIDIFFASLHTLDWEKLSNQFDGHNKSINLILGQTPEMFAQMVSHHVQQIGIYNIAKPYIFCHLSSEELTKATFSFLQNVPVIAGALGYFDDEKVGLTHSINNFKNKIPFMRSHGFLTKQFENKPVFLMGNGPSLDQAKEFISKHQDKAILVSCGSALSSLFKLGIKPDFHVELERTYPIKEWIETTTTPEYRKGIKLLAVNTVHPDLPKLFQTTGMALKYNDLGSTYLERYISDTELSVTLGSCNPTVTNCGLSFCAALGFVNIYMFGIDLGFPGGKHHSSHSFHYDIKEEEIDALMLSDHDDESNIILPGNFGGEIISNQLFLRSKFALEAILKDCKDIKCYNSSNGVAIEKTTPIEVKNIDTQNWEIFNKEKYTKTLFKKYFTNKNLLVPPTNEEIAKSFLPTLDVLETCYNLFEKEVNTFDEAIELLEKNELSVKAFSTSRKTSGFTRLIKGSSDSFSLMLAISLNTKNRQTGIQLFNEATNYYRKYLKSAQDAIKYRLLENDYHGYGIKEKLKANP